MNAPAAHRRHLVADSSLEAFEAAASACADPSPRISMLVTEKDEAGTAAVRDASAAAIAEPCRPSANQQMISAKPTSSAVLRCCGERFGPSR